MEIYLFIQTSSSLGLKALMLLGIGRLYNYHG